MKNTITSIPEKELNLKVLTKVVINFMKRDIFERYKKTREVTDEDWEFCELIDWHPVDELAPKPEHIKELKKALKETTGKVYNSAEEFFKELDSK
ncbi:hypothetical protein CMI39_03475 [Candidatus Pacearchaeota archaeon]|jgi:hypothetical protein|nr:hypothetical protein [Candidatus Pacearchaeota archaeon]|tara:strand:+ start:19751 stop:20035 length:285 start_codon:yes stop_codon:yes gene_type:complete